LKAFENRVLREIFGYKRGRIMGDCITRSFVICRKSSPNVITVKKSVGTSHSWE